MVISNKKNGNVQKSYRKTSLMLNCDDIRNDDDDAAVDIYHELQVHNDNHPYTDI